MDREEQAFIDSVESGEWTRADDAEQLIREAKDYANGTLLKNKRMNIRISERDLRNLKIRALEEGLPYQTLVSTIIHKYLAGRFHEKPS